MISVSTQITEELDFIFVSLLTGGLLVFLYDILRIFRRVVHHGTIWIACEDIVYWIACVFLIFAMFYRMNDGLVRGFAILSLTLGMLLYNSLVSRWTVRGIAYVINWIRKMLAKPLRRCARMSKKVKKLLKKMVKAIKISLCKL